MTLPAISLWQPWASLLFTDPPAKIHETRHWPAPFRLLGARIAIHAAMRLPQVEPELAELCADRFGADWRRTLPRGAIVGTAILTRCTRMGPRHDQAQPASPADRLCGDWTDDRWAWRLTDRKPLASPIVMPGRQGWFGADVPGGA